MSKIIQDVGAIVSPSGADLIITVEVDTKTNKTSLRANKIVNRLYISAILQQHALSLTNQVLADAVKPDTGKVQ